MSDYFFWIGPDDNETVREVEYNDWVSRFLGLEADDDETDGDVDEE